jgi:hypothetical protein
MDLRGVAGRNGRPGRGAEKEANQGPGGGQAGVKPDRERAHAGSLRRVPLGAAAQGSHLWLPWFTAA